MRALLLLAALAAPDGPTATYLASNPNCYDGDTCRFDLVMPQGLRHSQKVRLLGIDAPEMRGGTLESRQMAEGARDTLRAWLAAAKDLRVQVTLDSACTDPDGCERRDKYGRLLGVVLADGVDVNQKMLKAKLAVPYGGGKR